MVFGFLQGAFETVVRTGANIATSGIEAITGGTYGRQVAGRDIFTTQTGKVLSTTAAAVAVPLLAVGAGKAAKYIVTNPAGAVSKLKATKSLASTAAIGAFGVSLLSSSPKARETLSNLPSSIVSAGERAGRAIEDVEAGKKSGTEALGDVLKTGSLLGAGALLATEGGKIIKEFASKKQQAASLPKSGGIISPITPSTITPESSPVIADAKQEEVQKAAASIPAINIKIRNNPQINIAVAV